jgi:hypothetical protein
MHPLHLPTIDRSIHHQDPDNHPPVPQAIPTTPVKVKVKVKVKAPHQAITTRTRTTIIIPCQDQEDQDPHTNNTIPTTIIPCIHPNRIIPVCHNMDHRMHRNIIIIIRIIRSIRSWDRGLGLDRISRRCMGGCRRRLRGGMGTRR